MMRQHFFATLSLVNNGESIDRHLFSFHAFEGCLGRHADLKILIVLCASHSGAQKKAVNKMRNFICLGRSTTALVSRQSESGDLPITAIAPIPSSEDAFFVSHGPTCTIHKVEVLRVQVGLLL